MATVSFGTPATVDANTLRPLSVVKLTSTLAMALFWELSAFKAKTITIGNPPAVNAEVTIESGAFSSINDNNVDLVRLTDTSAMVTYYDGTNQIARVLTVSGTTITVNAKLTLSEIAFTASLSTINSTNVLYAYRLFSSQHVKAVVLSVSGTTITENTILSVDNSGTSYRITKCAVYSTSKAIIVWYDVNVPDQIGIIIDISGTTLTKNSTKSIDNVNIPEGDRKISTFLIMLDATHAVYGFSSATSLPNLNTEFAYILELSGTTFNIGAQFSKSFAIIQYTWIAATALSGSRYISILVDPTNEDYTAELFSVSGTTITFEADDTLSVTTADWLWLGEVDNENVILHYNDSSSAVVVLNSPAVGLSLAPMTKPADIDAAGTFIYLALLDGGTPILTKISTALSADGTTIFDPGAGDNIGVECGRFSSDTVWVAGNFDGTNVVEKSEDGGSSFTVKDGATIGDVRTFVMGPDSDERILVFDETNGDILETKDDGNIWTNINASVTPEVNAIGRLGKNVEESVFGNDGGANDSIDYSVNSGDDLEDFQTGVYPNANATRVIVN